MADRWPAKDPDAVLDFFIDWSAWLDADTISVSQWIIEPTGELTVDTSTESNGVTTVWLSGGVDGKRYLVTNRITTVGNRTDDRYQMLTVSEK